MKTKEPHISIPERFTITEKPSELIIEYKWNRVYGTIYIIISILWSSVLGFVITKLPSEALFVTAFPGLLGLILFYVGLCCLFNTSTITCNDQSLSIKASPLPALANKTIVTANLKQLYFNKKITDTTSGTTITYQLHALDHKNKSRRLIRLLNNKEEASFLEKKMRSFYKMEGLDKT